MNPEDNNIDEVLKRHLPSASQAETEADCDQVLQHLRARAQQKESSSAKPRVRWFAMVAAAAILLTVFISAKVFREAPAVLEVAARKVHFGEVVSSNVFGEVVVLSDGSRVEMRTDSELVLERADDGVRVRLMKGGVIVNAAKQRSGHLYVQTKDVLVSTIGTVFLVNAEAEGSRVAVYEGEVRVQEGGKERKLRSGEQVATNPRMEPLAMKEAISWSRQAETTAALLTQPVPAIIQGPASPRVAFEEVSIRSGGTVVPGARRGGLANVNIRGTGCSAGGAPEIDPRRFAVFTKSVFSVITMAYFGGGFQTCQYVTPLAMLTGGPEWIKSDPFDIQATIPEGSFTTTPTLHDPKLKKMLQTMLEERFKLTLRRETKEMPVYVMTLQDPSRLVPSNDGLIWATKKPDYWNEGMEQRQGTVAAEGPWVYGLNATMTELLPLLGRLTGRPIVDRTGFTGRFIFSVVYDMEFTRPLDPRDGIGPGDIKFPGDPRPPNEIKSLLSILEKEAGISLAPSKEPVEVLIIDHVERPTEN